MQRTWSTFPGGWPGAGLLLLRAAIGLALVVQAISCMLACRDFGFLLMINLLKITSGAILLIGYLTPIACILAALLSLGSAFSWIPVPGFDLFQDNMTVGLTIVIALAIMCLGPGSLSLDARLFGRKEIVIPAAPPPRGG